jgi:predicted nucleic acid-binding protein
VAYYVDTSAFLKLVVAEDHSDALRAWAADHDDDLFSSDLLTTEALRTARRHSTAALGEARRRLDALTIVRLGPDVFERAAELDPTIRRTLDALHLAAALLAGDELEGIVTYDQRLADAAAAHGVASITPTEPSRGEDDETPPGHGATS